MSIASCGQFPRGAGRPIMCSDAVSDLQHTLSSVLARACLALSESQLLGFWCQSPVAETGTCRGILRRISPEHDDSGTYPSSEVDAACVARMSMKKYRCGSCV